MKNVYVLAAFVFPFVITGCATHRNVRTSSDPATSVYEECVETGNGSTNCEHHVDSKIIGGGREGYELSPYSSLTVMHPPVRMIPMVDQSNGQRAMGDIPGSVMIMHPGATNGLNQRLDQMQRDQDTITIVVAQDHEDVKKLKKNAGKDPKKSPPANEAGGAPSVDP